MKPTSVVGSLASVYLTAGLVNRLTLEAKLPQFSHIDAIFRQHLLKFAQPVDHGVQAGATPTKCSELHMIIIFAR